LPAQSFVGYTRRSFIAIFLSTFMVAIVETIWLFVCGLESVRVIREATPEGGVRLVVYGPGNSQAVHEFEDPITCSTQQSEMERRLVAEGFALAEFTDRRSGEDRRKAPRGSDRRR
jgi:hypothetical protein